MNFKLLCFSVHDKKKFIDFIIEGFCEIECGSRSISFTNLKEFWPSNVVLSFPFIVSLILLKLKFVTVTHNKGRRRQMRWLLIDSEVEKTLVSWEYHLPWQANWQHFFTLKICPEWNLYLGGERHWDPKVHTWNHSVSKASSYKTSWTQLSWQRDKQCQNTICPICQTWL